MVCQPLKVTNHHGQGGVATAASHAQDAKVGCQTKLHLVFNGNPAMTTSITSEALSNAIVQAVETGAYPEAEDVASSEIGPSVLPEILKELSQARQRVQVSHWSL